MMLTVLTAFYMSQEFHTGPTEGQMQSSPAVIWRQREKNGTNPFTALQVLLHNYTDIQQLRRTVDQ